jgi:hypothetical protein
MLASVRSRYRRGTSWRSRIFDTVWLVMSKILGESVDGLARPIPLCNFRLVVYSEPPLSLPRLAFFELAAFRRGEGGQMDQPLPGVRRVGVTAQQLHRRKSPGQGHFSTTASASSGYPVLTVHCTPATPGRAAGERYSKRMGRTTGETHGYVASTTSPSTSIATARPTTGHP